MGCVNSRRDSNDQHPNLFRVMNVDDLGNLIAPGKLQVTTVEIILHQRNKPPVKWPLRCLRRYGHDAEIFSFESGRRCSTGPGIYAFKCSRAEQLFNLVQANTQVLFPIFTYLQINITPIFTFKLIINTSESSF